MAFFLQLFLLVAGANAAVHRERHQAATLSFEVSSGALVRRHQDDDQDSNATEEANGTDDLEVEVGMGGDGEMFLGLFDDVGAWATFFG